MSDPDCRTRQRCRSELVNAESIRNYSELFRAECLRLMSETHSACERMQKDDANQLCHWVRHTQFVRTELELKLEEIIVEISDLITLQSRVVKALEACKVPLSVSMICQEERMRRPLAERLLDEVNTELQKERELIEKVASLLTNIIEQTTEQIRLNRSVKYLLEQDLKEKPEAQSIDNSYTLMNRHSTNNLQTSSDTIQDLPSLNLNPWEQISDVNIAKAEQQKTHSQALRALVESLLEQTASDMQRQVQATAAAFQRNIQEIKSDKSRLEDQLDKILPEFASLTRTIEDLQVSITKTKSVLGLAQSRLALHQRIPGKERCCDLAKSHLLANIQEVTTDIDKMQEALARSQSEHRALVRCQLELQESIEMKTKSLYIDEVLCAHHREPIIIHNF